MIICPSMRALFSPMNQLMYDPYFSYVVLLAHCDTETSNTWVNSCPRGNTITDPGGATVLDTGTKKFGAGSVQTNSVLQRLDSGTHADYAFGTSDWTVEFWQRLYSLTLDFNSIKVHFSMLDSVGTNAWAPYIYTDNTSGNLKYWGNGAVRIDGGNVLSASTWQHIALCRKSGVTRLFVDGVQKGSDFADTNTYVQGPVKIGCAYNNGGASLGNRDDIRMTNGIGRYDSDFSANLQLFPWPNQ